MDAPSNYQGCYRDEQRWYQKFQMLIWLYLHFHVIRNIFFFLDKAYCWEASELCLMSVDYAICNDFGISFIEIYASLMATIKNNKLACME